MWDQRVRRDVQPEGMVSTAAEYVDASMVLHVTTKAAGASVHQDSRALVVVSPVRWDDSARTVCKCVIAMTAVGVTVLMGSVPVHLAGEGRNASFLARQGAMGPAVL